MKTYFLFIILIVATNLKAQEKELIFGIVPQQSADVLIESWSPLIEKLKVDCRCQIRFATAPSIAEFETKIKKGEFDLVYLNPLHFIQAQKIGYTSLVREENRKLKGILVVKKDSTFQKISDLKGKKIAFPGETAFAATVLVQKKLQNVNIEFESQYVKSHDSVYLNVISGMMSAGGGVNRSFESLSEDDKSQLRILDETQSVTPHPIAIKKTVSKDQKELILQSLVNLKNSEEGKKILEKLEFKALVKSQDSDWDDVRAITKGQKLN